MAKLEKAPPARRQNVRAADAESVFLQSAQALGRVIGSLQRELDGATRRLTGNSGSAVKALTKLERGGDGANDTSVTRTKSRGGKARTVDTESRAASVSASDVRKAKRASKSAMTRKGTSRKRSGSRRTAGKGKGARSR